jgi:hypothetical protein
MLLPGLAHGEMQVITGWQLLLLDESVWFTLATNSRKGNDR